MGGPPGSASGSGTTTRKKKYSEDQQAVVDHLTGALDQLKSLINGRFDGMGTQLATALEKIDQLTDDNKKLTEKNKALEEQIAALKAQAAAKAVELVVVEGVANFAKMQALDADERWERACNVIVKGMDIPDINQETPQNVLVAKVTEKLQNVEGAGVDLAAGDVVEVVRLASRMFKLKFKDVRTRAKLFRKRRAIRLATNQQLRVQEDLTRQQQAHVAKLQPVFQVLRNEAEAGGRWGPFFRGGLLYHHPGPVVPGQPQQAELHSSNWDPTVLAAALGQTHTHAAQAAAGQHPPVPAPQQA
jgi:hypothetical protein